MMRRVEAATEQSYAHELFSREPSLLERKMEHEAHADLFDRIVMAIRAEGIKSAIAELGDAVVKDGQQLDIQPSQSLVFEVVVKDHLAVGCGLRETIVASTKSYRTLNIRF